MKKHWMLSLWGILCFFAVGFPFFGCSAKKIDAMQPEELRDYMVKLAKEERYEQAAECAERYLATGLYFAGLGLFTSVAYEKTGDTANAVLYAFLDYEFLRSGAQSETDTLFLANLAELEKGFLHNGPDAAGLQAIALVRSCFDASVPYEENAIDGSFVSSYIIAINRIRDNKAAFAELGDYLAIEKYFIRFAAYYWNARPLLAVVKAPISSSIGCLEKVIALRPDSDYARAAYRLLAELTERAND